MAPARTVGYLEVDGDGAQARRAVMRVPATIGRGATGGQLAGTLAASSVAAILLVQTGSWAVPLGLVAAATLLVVGLVHPAFLVTVFLFTRPLIDDFSDVTLGAPGANVAGLLGLLVVGVAIGYAVRTRERARAEGFAVFVALLMTTAVFAMLGFLNFKGAVALRPLTEIARLAALLAMYFLALNLFGSVDRARRLTVVVALSALGPALFGIKEWIGGAPVKENIDIARISGTFVGPNPFATYVGLGALILIVLPRGLLPGWVRFLGVAAMATALVGTYSRGGWIFFLAGLLILGWRTHKAAVLALAVGAVVVVAAVPTVQQRVLPSQTPTTSTKETYESFGWRADNWKGLLDRWSTSPLVGFGVESVPLVNPRVPVGGAGRFSGGYDAHNLAVKSLVEGGVLYLLAWAAFLFVMALIAFRLARDQWPLRQIARLLAVVWPLIAMLSLTTSEPTSETALMFALLAMTGALEGAHQRWRRERFERERFEARDSAARSAQAGRRQVPQPA